jgi:hypothetical protein
MMFKKIAAAVALVAAAPAFAAIAIGTTGNGELFLTVQDAQAKVSYTLDLGIRQNDFLTLGQSETGYQRNWALTGDSYFAQFLSVASEANFAWAVLANDATGIATVGGYRTFTTVRAGQEAAVGGWTNQLFTNGTAVGQFGTFFDGINRTGSHGNLPPAAISFDVNGSSVNYELDPGRAYFGELGGATPNFNGTAPFFNTNAVNVASNFVYVTRSSPDQAAGVLVDQFDNSVFDGKFTLQRNAAGAYNLNYTLQPVPEPSTYGLLLAGLAAVGFVARRRPKF